MPSQKTGTLRFERSDKHFRVGINGQIAGRDAHIPATGAPFSELVVGEGAGGNSEDRLPLERGIEQLENVGLARAGRRLHNDIPSALQGAHRLLLPEIRHDQVDLQPLQHSSNIPRSETVSNTHIQRAFDGRILADDPPFLTKITCWRFRLSPPSIRTE